MSNINQNLSEMEFVEELRDRLDGILSPKMKEDTDMFIRFLKARNYDLDAAEIMLRNHIYWQDLHKADDILSWYKPLQVADYIPISFVGFDKEGSVVSYIAIGNMDMRGLTRSMSLKDFQKFYIHMIENYIKTLEEQSLKLKKKISKMVYIFDFENFSLKTATHKASLDFFKDLVSSFDANYPERLKLAVFSNTSLYFQIGFAVIKPLISGPTIQKIKIFGKSGWQEELLKNIDSDVLPVFLGGSRTDPDGDPRCKTFIKYAKIIPERLYLTHQKKKLEQQSGMKKIIINRLSKKLIELIVMNSDSDIEWEFATKDKDIYFCLLYRDFNKVTDELKEVIPKLRIDASIEPEAGVYKCQKPGKYFLEFDNSYSLIYQKEVYYKVQIVSSHISNNVIHYSKK